MTASDETVESDTVQTRGIECLAAANYQSFFDVIDKFAAQRGIDRTTLRNALADLVDDDIDAALGHGISREVLLEARDNCRQVAQRDYSEYY